MTDTRVTVAGGGLAGAAAAALLARAGRQVVVFERTTGPTDKICGEFLSYEAIHLLRRIGLDPARLGGQTIAAVRLTRGNQIAEARLPFTALGLSRRVLDEALLAHAADCGATVRRGCTIARADTAALHLTDGEIVAAQTLLLATGKHDLRGVRRAATGEDLVGFKTHYTLSPLQLAALSGYVEVAIFPDAYVGLQRIEAGRANLCLLVRRRFLEQSGGSFETLLEQLQRDSTPLRTRLHAAEPLLLRPLTIFRVPYGFVHRHRPQDSANTFRLGDQAAVIPSFTGDGIAIALHTAALAAGIVLSGGDAGTYHRQLRRDIFLQVRRAWWLYRLGACRPGQAAIMAAARRWPPTLRWAASLTRVAEHALTYHRPLPVEQTGIG